MSTVLKRNTKVPTENVGYYTTVQDNQDSIAIRVRSPLSYCCLVASCHSYL
jgi:molecular chaperone DnaK (HSP70)